MVFEWDPIKEEANRAKHGVDFHEAATVFGDPLSLTVQDPDHSVGEQRYITMGETPHGSLLVVAHTDRHGRIRVISARQATRRERRVYEQAS